MYRKSESSDIITAAIADTVDSYYVRQHSRHSSCNRNNKDSYYVRQHKL